MSKMQNVCIVIALLSLLMLTGAQAQGLYWESTIKMNMGSERQMTSKSYYMPKMLKQERDGEGDASIIRLDEQKIISVNSKEKTYSEMTFDEINATMNKAGSSMDSRMAEMKKKMEGMPPEQRKMVEQMMKQYGAGAEEKGKFTSEQTGAKKTISGYDCTQYIIKKDGEPFLTLWTTKSVPGYSSMRDEMKSFSSKLMAMNPRAKGVAQVMGTVDGFPIQTEMGTFMTTTVTKIIKQSTPAKEFEVPAGYKKVKSPIENANKELDEQKSED